MGETLNGASELDIDTEIKTLEERLSKLQAEEANEGEITMAMKDFGLQRFHIWNFTH